MNPFLNLIDLTLLEVDILEDTTLILKFEDYKLIIYNNYMPNKISVLKKFVQNTVLEIKIKEGIIFELIFTGEMNIVVFIDDDSYNTPEAMELIGPNNLIAIWQ